MVTDHTLAEPPEVNIFFSTSHTLHIFAFSGIWGEREKKKVVRPGQGGTIIRCAQHRAKQPVSFSAGIHQVDARADFLEKTHLNSTTHLAGKRRIWTAVGRTLLLIHISLFRLFSLEL